MKFVDKKCVKIAQRGGGGGRESKEVDSNRKFACAEEETEAATAAVDSAQHNRNIGQHAALPRPLTVPPPGLPCHCHAVRWSKGACRWPKAY